MKGREGQRKLEGHRDRLRERFLERGLQGFNDAEVVELLLSLGTPRQDCKERAREAIRRFGSLAGVLEAPVEELLKVPGIGPRNSVALKLVHEVARAFLRSRIISRDYRLAMKEAAQFLQHRLRMEQRELMVILFLNKAMEIVGVEETAVGTHDRAAIYPREIARMALRLDAFHLVLAHNHPGGDPRPSESDLRATRELARILQPLEIRLEDHLVVTPHGIFSLAAHGLLEGSGPKSHG